jgi:hypothetical protein
MPNSRRMTPSRHRDGSSAAWSPTGGRAAVSVRDFWQNYPKGFRGDRRGRARRPVPGVRGRSVRRVPVREGRASAVLLPARWHLHHQARHGEDPRTAAGFREGAAARAADLPTPAAADRRTRVVLRQQGLLPRGPARRAAFAGLRAGDRPEHPATSRAASVSATTA